MSLRKGSATMRMSIGIPGFSIYFEHHQVKPFIKDQSKKAKKLFHERVVPAVLRGTCRACGLTATEAAGSLLLIGPVIARLSRVEGRHPSTSTSGGG